MLSNENISRKRRIIYSLFVAFTIYAVLVVRIGFIQFIQGRRITSNGI